MLTSLILHHHDHSHFYKFSVNAQQSQIQMIVFLLVDARVDEGSNHVELCPVYADSVIGGLPASTK